LFCTHALPGPFFCCSPVPGGVASKEVCNSITRPRDRQREMTLGAVLPSLRKCAGAVLLVGGLLAPTPAHAGCGDYVVVQSSQGQTQHHSMPVPSQSTGSGKPVSSDKPNPQPHQPCTSAGCVPPGDMPLTRSSVTSAGADQWARPDPDRHVFGVQHSMLSATRELLVHQVLPTSIYHPPRTTSH